MVLRSRLDVCRWSVGGVGVRGRHDGWVGRPMPYRIA